MRVEDQISFPRTPTTHLLDLNWILEIGNSRGLWTLISRVLENIFICLVLWVNISYNLYCLNSMHMCWSSYCLNFCVPWIVRQLYAICHINVKTTRRYHNIFCVSRMRHTKEGEQYCKRTKKSRNVHLCFPF